jgi:hypothetical protein
MMQKVSISETAVNFYEDTQHKIPNTEIFILAAVKTGKNLISIVAF